MTETSHVWHTVREQMAMFGRMRRIENRCDKGTPDCNYTLRRKPVLPACSGWLELKYLPKWPARAGTPVRIDHLTQDQVDFLVDEASVGGRAWLLLRVGTDHWCMMRPPQVVRLHALGYTAAALLADCRVGQDSFPRKEILTFLTE